MTSQRLPLIFIVAAFIWSAVTLGLRREQEAPPGTSVIRIGHWQLEAGVREAFDKLGKEFAADPYVQKKYGKVLVVQDAIPDQAYSQWMTSQLMGKTAPDLLEIGQLPDPIMLSFQSRYFVPLTELANRPNPFNRGTAMEGVPLKETFLDGMRAGYQQELQAYMRVPLSRFTSRVFYNRTLLHKLTGRDEPPRELRAFLDLCKQINAIRLPDNSGTYNAIASSGGHAANWYANVADPLSYTNLFVADMTRDGSVGSDETFAAIMAGNMHLTDLPWKAKFDITRQLDDQFNIGFAGLGRDEALFLFAQQRAVFISTGIWELSSLKDQAHGQFDVGISDFPRPAANDPQFGSLALGPLYDPAGAAFPFGVYRLSKHPELAQDFLLYLASVRGNKELNDMVGWIPSVAGVPIPPDLAKFAPSDQGIYANGNLALGGNTYNSSYQAFSKFQTDPSYSYDQFVTDFMKTYPDLGKRDWDEQQRDWRRGILNNEKFLAGIRGQALRGNARPLGIDSESISRPNADDPLWITYRSFMSMRQVFPEIDHADQLRMIEHQDPRPVGPYDYLPQAIENAKRHLDQNTEKP